MGTLDPTIGPNVIESKVHLYGISPVRQLPSPPASSPINTQLSPGKPTNLGAAVRQGGCLGAGVGQPVPKVACNARTPYPAPWYHTIINHLEWYRTEQRCGAASRNIELSGDDHAPVTRGRMRAQYPLPHGLPHGDRFAPSFSAGREGHVHHGAFGVGTDASLSCKMWGIAKKRGPGAGGLSSAAKPRLVQCVGAPC